MVRSCFETKPRVACFASGILAACLALCRTDAVVAQELADPTAELATAEPDPAAKRQAELDAAFSEMLSGATLEGSFTSTAPGSDPTKLSREKYTLGEVRKIEGDLWLIPARIQYGEHDVLLPITLPVRWAGDTPLIVVDNVGLPGFGTVSARVMFFDGHYAGWWKHGKQGGHLFGIIRKAQEERPEDVQPSDAEASGSDEPARQQQQKQARE